ncbi:BrnT family toxin [Oxalobacteraceae bacterium A2-2]
MRFEWDPAKAAANVRTHGVSFDEASTVLLSDDAAFIFDGANSVLEDRYLATGLSDRLRLITVCHCYEGSRVRIISAWKATARETRRFQERGV